MGRVQWRGLRKLGPWLLTTVCEKLATIALSIAISLQDYVVSMEWECGVRE